jgi:hypothetical protein
VTGVDLTGLPARLGGAEVDGEHPAVETEVED